MKEKIKKLGLYLCSWRFNIYMNVGFVLYHILQMIMDFHIANLVAITFHLGYIAMLCILDMYDIRHLADRASIDLIRTIAGDFAYDLKRYKELYGELPKEGTKEEPHDTDK